MSKKESNILEIKLERVIKKHHNSEFNKELKPIPNHPASVSQLWSLPLETKHLNTQSASLLEKCMLVRVLRQV
jgi:hypothetical protein